MAADASRNRLSLIKINPSTGASRQSGYLTRYRSVTTCISAAGRSRRSGRLFRATMLRSARGHPETIGHSRSMTGQGPKADQNAQFVRFTSISRPQLQALDRPSCAKSRSCRAAGPQSAALGLNTVRSQWECRSIRYRTACLRACALEFILRFGWQCHLLGSPERSRHDYQDYSGRG